MSHIKIVIFTLSFRYTCYLNLPGNELVQILSVMILMKQAGKSSETFKQKYYAKPALLNVSSHKW
jgi:hypothetical protein